MKDVIAVLDRAADVKFLSHNLYLIGKPCENLKIYYYLFNNNYHISIKTKDQNRDFLLGVIALTLKAKCLTCLRFL